MWLRPFASNLGVTSRKSFPTLGQGSVTAVKKMVDDICMALVKQAIDDLFNQKSYLRDSLTAAGADPEYHDGYRKCPNDVARKFLADTRLA